MVFELVEEETVEEESLPSMIGRGAARTGARVGEAIAGFPGDIFSLINDFIAAPATEAVTGSSQPYEETILGKIFPTSTKHQEFTEKATGEYLKPQTSYEKFADEVASDTTSLLVPGAKGGSFVKGLFSKLAISTAGNTVKEAIEDVTKSPTKAQLGKFSTIFLLSLFDKPAAAKAVGELYKPLQKRVGNLSPVDATRLESDLAILQNKMKKGTLAPSEKFVFEEAQLIRDKIKSGKISPEEAWASKRSLNEKLSKQLFDIPRKADQARAKKLAKSINGMLQNTLSETAKQDPQFYKQLKEADQAFGVISKSNLVSNAIEKHLKYTPLTHGLVELLSGPVATTAGAAVVPYQLGKVMYQIAKSPTLAKHYAKVVSAAAAENAPVMNRELKALDKGLQKKEKTSKYELVE